MRSWRSPTLGNAEQALIRDGLAVEFAPGRIRPVDLAATPAMRAALVCPLLPRRSTPTTLTAYWIHTGLWPTRRTIRLCAAHPTHSHHPIVQRVLLPEEFAVVLGGHRVPAPPRTAYDLLVAESPEVSIECVLALLRTCLDIAELREHCEREGKRRRASFAKRWVTALERYLGEAATPDIADDPPARGSA